MLEKINWWSKEEDQVLKDNYSKLSKQELINKFPKRTWVGIQSRAYRVFKLSRNTRSWSSEEIGILYDKYPRGGWKLVSQLLPLRPKSSIISVASRLKIKFIRGKGDISPLLDLNPISCYWIGLLLSDGHFNLKAKKCVLTLAKKDEDVVRRFANFVSSPDMKPNTNNSVTVSIYSKNGVPKLCSMFSIQSNKTYNPPNISLIEKNKDLMLSMLIGLIDGDGCIYHTKDCNAAYMRLMCHDSWLGIYRKFNAFLINNFKNNGVDPRCYVRCFDRVVDLVNRRYLDFGIYDNYLLKSMKREAIRMNLPIMSRKWNKVDLGYVSEREKTPIVMETIKKMLNQGLIKSEIIKSTGYTLSRVGWAMKKLAKQETEEKEK